MRELEVAFIAGNGKEKARATLEVADTDRTRAAGLSKRASLPNGRGMLFDRAGVYWMKDVEFPLDLTFLSKEGEVLETLEMPVDKDGLFHYSPSVRHMDKAAMTIETPMGFIAENGINPGDTVVAVGRSGDAS